MKIKKSLSRRLLAMIMSLIMIISVVPVGVISVFAQSASQGTVESVTTGVEVDTEGSVSTALADAVKLQWLEKDESVGRMNDGWSVGVKITAPDNMTVESDFTISETAFVRYQSKPYGEEDYTGEKLFWDDQHSDKNNAESTARYMLLWAYVNEEVLNDAKASGINIAYRWQFDWNGDETYDQTVVIEIDPETINLAMEETVVYPSTSLPEIKVTDSAKNEIVADVSGNKSNYITVNTNSETVVCSASDGNTHSIKVSIIPDESFKETTIAYQKMSATGWITDEYKRNKETDNITLWTTLNSETFKKGEDITSQWRFDWDGDGIFEQMISLVVDDENIILADYAANQIYPALGSVTITDVDDISNEEVIYFQGNNTGFVRVDLMKLSLGLREVGDKESWWTKTVITVPENISDEMMKNATFEITDKNTEIVVDGAISDGDRNLIVWMEVTPELINEVEEVFYDLTIDYNGSGNFYKQEIMYSLKNSDDIVLVKNTQDAFAFENSNIKPQWVGNGYYENEAPKGGSGDGDITYSLSDESKQFATIDAETGKVTYIDENFESNENGIIGTITVIATKDGKEKYEDVTAEYSFDLVKTTVSDKLSFTYGSSPEVTYGEDSGESFVNNEFTNTAKSSATISEGAKLKYEIVEQTALDGTSVSGDVATIDAENGKVTVHRSGIVKVRASASETKHYAAGYAEYTLKINKGNQKELGVVYIDDANIITYSASETPDIDIVKEVFGGTTGGKITYASTNKECATVDPDTGKVKTNKVGTFAIEITMAGNDCYNDVSVETSEITIVKAKQKGFAFEFESPTIVYNENKDNVFVNRTIGGSGDGKITYDIAKEYEDIAVLTGEDGKLKILKAGVVIVTAIKSGGDNYIDATAKCILTIKCADQEIRFENESVKLYYGVTEFASNPLNSVVKEDSPDGKGYGEGAITYSISENNIGATIDETTGVVSFTDSEGKTGTVTIKAVKAGDVRYNECESEYTIIVEHIPVPEEKYTITGNKGKIDGKETGWYVGDVVIKAPEGYLISTDNELSTTSWDESIVVNADGIFSKYEVYYKDANGHITDVVLVEEFKRDVTPVSFGKITYEEPNAWENFVGTIGSWFGGTGATIDVTVEVSDATSGIYQLKYYVDGTEQGKDITVNIKDGVCKFPIEGKEINQATIKYIAIDNAGNKVEYHDGVTIIINNNPPELKTEYVFAEGAFGNVVDNEDSIVVYSNNNVTVDFVITEQNFETLLEKGVKPVLTVNGEEKETTWIKTETENVYKASIVLECEENSYADYEVVCSYDNKIYDKVESATTVIIDREKAIISGDFNDDEVKNTVDGHLYYNTEQIFEIAIKDHTFTAENVELVVSGEGTTEELRDYLNEYKNPDKWSQREDGSWVASVTFDVDSKYKLEVIYTDLVSNVSETFTKEFTVDTGAPTVPVITYGKSIINKLIEGITFGIFEAPVEVTVTSSDDLSGLEKIEYSYVSTEGDYAYESVDVANEDGEITFVIPAEEEDFQFRGVVSATAYDMSQNSSETVTTGTDAEGNEIGGIIFDTVNPERMVILSEAQRVVDKTTSEFVDDFVYSNENQNAILYYNDKATITFMINETNFVAEDVVVKVNDTRRLVNNWQYNEENGSYIGTTTLTTEGSYIVTVDYEDRSGNKMKNYTSEQIVIDKTPVEIDFGYNEEEVITKDQDIRYFNKVQSVTISVEDESLRLNEFELEVNAMDFNGKVIEEVDVSSYADKAASIENWVKSEDGFWQLTLDFESDARYVIKTSYYDLAKNRTDSTTEFVVDKTSPQNLNMQYSENVFSAIVETLTFGYYQDSAIVTFEASDNVAGLDSFVINVSTEGSKAATDLTLPEDCTIDLDNSVISGESGFITDYSIEKASEKVMVSIVVPAQFSGKFLFDAIDRSGNKTTYSDNNAVVTDTINPKVEITYSGAYRDMVEADEEGKKPSRQSVDTIDENTRFVYGGAVTANVKIAEANFYPEDVDIRVELDGEEIEFQAGEWSMNADEGVHSLEVVFEADGDYKLFVEYTDRSENAMDYSDELTTMSGSAVYESNIITVDTTKPVMNVTYDNTVGSENKYFDKDRTATITIDDRNFRPNEVELTIKSADVDGNEIVFDYSELVSWSDWNQDGTVWTATVPFSEDGNYTVDLTYNDIAQNKVENDYHAEFCVDTSAPENLEIIYSESLLEKVIEGITFGFYQAEATVTLKATDKVSGVNFFSVDVKTNGSVNATDVDLPENLVISADGSINAGKAGFVSDVIPGYEAGGISSVSFKVPAQYRGEFIFSATDKSLNQSDMADDNHVLVVDTISPVFDITYAGDLKDKVEKDGEKISRQTVSNVDVNTRFVYSSAITATLTVEEANFYEEDVVVTVEHDGKKVDNLKMSEWKKNSDSDVYVSIITLETDGDYVVTVEYADSSTNDMEYTSSEFAGKNGVKKYVSNILSIDTVKPVLKVTYDNNDSVNGKYYNKNRTATIEITDRNFRPNEVVFAIKSTDVDGNPIVYNYSSLTSWSDWKQDGITWKTTVPFSEDGNYTVDLTYTDIAGHKIEEDFHDEFTIDKVAPNELEVVYSESVLEKVIEGLTFGYYKADATVTLKATDKVAGVDYFTLDSKQNGPDVSTTVSLPKDLVISAEGKVVSGSAGFVSGITASSENGVTSVSFKVPAQYRGEFMFSATDRAHNKSELYDDNKVVVVDNIAPGREVMFTPTNIVSESTMLDIETFDEDDNVVLYYNEDAVITFKITEANFYEEDVSVKVNGVSQTIRNWTNSGDEWTGTITLTDEGDYVITVEYTDRSGNQMASYESHRIVIDKTVPVITVTYSDEIQNTLKDREGNDRKYYNKTQVATVLVKEHNFRADDVVVKVTAKDVLGNNVMQIDENGNVTSFTENGKNRSAWSPYETGTWRRTDDGFILEITYEADANYTFDIEYIDMAKNVAADYAPDHFTVDKTAPEKLEVIYGKTTVLEQVLENISFGFYNAQMTVSITAEDITSGVHHFLYSYINSEGVSKVNAQLIDQAISAAEIKYAGAKATATFKIPKLLLGNDNQFNGTVKFSAFDRAENETEKADTKRIVVDSIRPTAKVTFNQPIKSTANISYYSGAINATIVINEANFFSNDVNVTVTRDGSNYPVNVKWVNNSADVHTGTFTITGEGDYVVSVRYKDKSSNEMTPFQSNQLTIDSVIPKLTVSDVKNNSANKAEKYGFTVTASDRNLDASSFEPKLTAVVKNANGTYSTVNVSMGNVRTVKVGEVYAVTVDNLEDDAVYSLSSSVEDMAGNRYSSVVLEDGKEYSNVTFSINREGSTFTISDKYTSDVMSNYYVKEISKNIVIEEINVDPIEKYVVTLNGKVLKEGVDYTTTSTNKANEWFKRSYILKPELFEEENSYKIIIESIDKTDSKAYSDVKLLNASFVVDKTNPKFVISGVESDGRYSVGEQTVTVIPTDDGGRLQLFKVIILDSKGNPIVDAAGKDISVRFDMSGAELLEYLEANDGKVTFTIPEGYQQQIKIVCSDSAVDADGNANEYVQVFDRVTVSQSGWIIFYANKPLFYGVILGSALLIGGIIFLIFWKKRKKEE